MSIPLYLIAGLIVLYLSYIVVTGQTTHIDIGSFLLRVSPVTWALIGTCLCMGLSVLGAAWGIWMTGSTLVGVAVKEYRVRIKNLISVLLCEAAAIYGLVSTIVLTTKMSLIHVYSLNSVVAGYALFWGGLTVGVCNFVSAITDGLVGTSTAIADAENPSLFLKMLVVEIFASAVGLFGVIVGLMQVSRIVAT